MTRFISVIDVLSDQAYRPGQKTLDLNLHSPARRLIELKIEHADLDALVDISSNAVPIDELMLRRLKKRRLSLRDQISQLELALDPPEPA